MFEKVCGILSEFTDVDAGSMALDSELVGDLGINSLEIVEAVLRFENEFGVEIPDRVIGSFRVVGDVVRYLGGDLR